MTSFLAGLFAPQDFYTSSRFLLGLGTGFTWAARRF